MNTYPTTPAWRYVGTKVKDHIPLLTTKFESNYQGIRRTATRNRRVFTLKYETITYAEYTALRNFWLANVGQPILFYYAEENITLEVQMTVQDIEFTYTSGVRGDLTDITLEEA